MVGCSGRISATTSSKRRKRWGVGLRLSAKFSRQHGDVAAYLDTPLTADEAYRSAVNSIGWRHSFDTRMISLKLLSTGRPNVQADSAVRPHARTTRARTRVRRTQCGSAPSRSRHRSSRGPNECTTEKVSSPARQTRPPVCEVEVNRIPWCSAISIARRNWALRIIPSETPHTPGNAMPVPSTRRWKHTRLLNATSKRAQCAPGPA